MMLDRLGSEKARATSVVRYAPESYFPLHSHPGGEEILVLSGVLSDADGHYPAGWYLRNPPGSSHRPFTSSGAIIFVKLWQMRPSDTKTVRIDTYADTAWHQSSGRDICPLYSSESEEVCMLRLAPRATVFAASANTAELLVMNGSLRAKDGLYRRGTWMRFPEGELPSLTAGQTGACVFIKTGHLTNVGLKK